MRIKLNKLTIINFKGIKEKVIEFDEIMNIFGANGTGKTTIFDSVSWLLFDKDSQDRSTFDIKPLDENGEVNHGIESKVIGVFDVDGKEMILEKTFKEKWVKPNGEVTKVFKGNTTAYAIDGVPALAGPFKKHIASLIDENIFKLVTNPNFFSNMKWEEKRKLLFSVIGGFDDNRVYSSSNKMQELKMLVGDKDIETFKTGVKAKISAANKEIKNLPVRIDEANKSIVEADFESLELELDVLRSKVSDVEKEIATANSVPEWVNEKKSKLLDTKSKAADLKSKLTEEANEKPNKIKTKISDIKNKIRTIESQINSSDSERSRTQKELDTLNSNLEFARNEIQRLTKQNNELRPQVKSIKDEKFEFDDSKCNCPTCKQKLPEGNIADQKKKMFDNFEADKTRRIKDIQRVGVGNNKTIENHESLIKNGNIELETKKKALLTFESVIGKSNTDLIKLKASLEPLETELAAFKTVDSILKENAEYQRYLADINTVQTEIEAPNDLTSESYVLENKKTEIENEIAEINKKLGVKDSNENARARIQEYSDREKELGGIIASLEQQVFMCEEFTKIKVSMVDTLIDSKFDVVKFKLFDTQVNGAIVDCCEATVNGVPYSNVNHAGKINAGLDIIRALSSYYGISAPVFIDNRESVNNIIKLDSQVINLIVTTDEELRIGGVL